MMADFLITQSANLTSMAAKSLAQKMGGTVGTSMGKELVQKVLPHLDSITSILNTIHTELSTVQSTLNQMGSKIDFTNMAALEAGVELAEMAVANKGSARVQLASEALGKLKQSRIYYYNMANHNILSLSKPSQKPNKTKLTASLGVEICTYLMLYDRALASEQLCTAFSGMVQSKADFVVQEEIKLKRLWYALRNHVLTDIDGTLSIEDSCAESVLFLCAHKDQKLASAIKKAGGEDIELILKLQVAVDEKVLTGPSKANFPGNEGLFWDFKKKKYIKGFYAPKPSKEWQIAVTVATALKVWDGDVGRESIPMPRLVTI
mmetsp:Transcript_28690/g.31858  ORF Transcript_28690/g.31858 Transcript_28690/m.31858 type:complete len:320 (+) Transcript_28690:101-1060(+)